MIDIQPYGRRLAAVVDSGTAGGLVGAYMHGSLALGGFRPERSDVDVLVVIESSLPPDRQHALGVALLDAAYPCPGVDLECSIVTAATAADLGDCPFEVHVTSPDTVVAGDNHPGDGDLVLYAEVCRRSGITVAGPPAVSVFGAVPRRRLLDAVSAEMTWGLSSASFEYAVLTACRALLFATDGTLGSKIAGGEWYLAGHPGDAVVAAALARQRGTDTADAAATAEPPHDAVVAFVDHVRRKLGGT